jgi:hypothetical protein
MAVTNNWSHAFGWAAGFSLSGVIVVLVTSKYNTGVKERALPVTAS